MGRAARGKFFDKVFGKGTLNPLSRTIDEFEAGIATSRKSLDLNAATYQDFGRVSSRLNTYIDKLRSIQARNGPVTLSKLLKLPVGSYK